MDEFNNISLDFFCFDFSTILLRYTFTFPLPQLLLDHRVLYSFTRTIKYIVIAVINFLLKFKTSIIEFSKQQLRFFQKYEVDESSLIWTKTEECLAKAGFQGFLCEKWIKHTSESFWNRPEYYKSKLYKHQEYKSPWGISDFESSILLWPS